ncbi:hypothetical protein OsI_19105 [Oryza sativa Indica Group]|uniref:Uncharacterized protein n=1 Tax=Oryza sativa subsp. indica TaxID=39946 RepID=A2Y274_ORYSI|nr:hypothetical protein OsI_19105 [Oryza sativa Indica Group]
MASMVISMTRLIRHDYGDDNGNLRAALFIFYSLALAHIVQVGKQEFGLNKDFGGQKLLLQYLRETKAKCADDLSLPGGWNMVTYAVGLLKSVSRDDHLDGLRMLDAFVVNKRPSIRLELLSSSESIQNLIKMLQWTGPALEDQEMRERAARIVADVATGALHIVQIPGALQCISSLLQVSPLRQYCQEVEKGPQKQDQDKEGGEEEKDKNMNTAIDEQITDRLLRMDRRAKKFLFGTMDDKSSFKPQGTRELIHQGLQILERLACDDQNCREICCNQRLLTKIIAPITSPALLHTDYDNAWVDILSILLKLVRLLISAPGEAGTRVCHDISACEDAVRNLLGILGQNATYPMQLQENAMEILTEIAIGSPAIMAEDFIRKLWCIFLSNRGTSRLRRKAGEQLAKLLSAQGANGQVFVKDVFCENDTVVAQLIDILVQDKECQISAAAILEHLCCHFVRYNELSELCVVKLLRMILDLISKMEIKEETVPGAGESNSFDVHNDEESKPPKQSGPKKPWVPKNDELSEETKFLAALMSLLVVICNKMVDAHVFCYVTSVDAALVKKLKKIIEANNKNTADCLRIVKLACQVVIAIIHLKPSCIKDFNGNHFDAVLSTALKNMSDIDNCMLFAVQDCQITKPARTLSSLVKEAQGLLQNAQDVTVLSD